MDEAENDALTTHISPRSTGRSSAANTSRPLLHCAAAALGSLS
jgi:hypothetical protein